MSTSKNSLPTPFFFLLDRSKSLSRLHKARTEAKASSLEITLELGFPLKPVQPNSIAVGPMKPLQGPTPVEKALAAYAKTQRDGLEKL